MPACLTPKCVLFGATSVLLVVGCGCVRSIAPLGQPALAFSAAAITVTDSSEDAYTSANALHFEEQTALAVIDYDKSVAWNPADYTHPLLSEDQLLARRQVLDGLKTYAETIEELTSPGPNGALGDAAATMGSNLQQLSRTVQTSFNTGNDASISDTEKNVLSTALVALGMYLQDRAVQKKLPAVLEQNDKNVAGICDALIADVKVLRRQADKDYTTLEVTQDKYIRNAQPPLPPDQRREEIAKLPTMVREQQRNDLLLAKLENALRSLKATHHALATAAGDKNSAALKQSIAELIANGRSLTTYYESLNSGLAK